MKNKELFEKSIKPLTIDYFNSKVNVFNCDTCPITSALEKNSKHF